MNATASIVSRVWSFCTTLRDDGVGYGDYLEQLTYLIFLKMADVSFPRFFVFQPDGIMPPIRVLADA